MVILIYSTNVPFINYLECVSIIDKLGGRMSKRIVALMSCLAVVSAVALMVGCGSLGGTGGGQDPITPTPTPTGSVVTFGTDAPICDVESFVVTITSASLVPQSGGSPVSLISSTAPATVDFSHLVDFTNILSFASTVPAGTYSSLQVTLSNPQLIVVNTSTSPATPQSVPVTLTGTSSTFTISPALVVSSGVTSALNVDFNLFKSLAVDSNGQVTGTVDPEMTISSNSAPGLAVGAADALYGTVQSVSTSGLPSGYTGSFVFALGDGTGQTVTVLTNSDTNFQGDGVTSFANLTANTFVEASATVNSNGQIVAQEVDAEEQTSTANQQSAFLGRIINVTRVGAGNATGFTLLVDDEVPDLSSVVPLYSTLNVALSGTVAYFTNEQGANRQGFTFGPQTIGLGQKVAVFGSLQAGSTLAASNVFLRPQNLLGTFQTLQASGSDNKTGAFAMAPCSTLFGGKAVTVMTYSNTYFTGASGLTGLASTPMLDTTGLLYYQLTSGTTPDGAAWTAPAWVIEAVGVHQPPN